MRATCKSRLSRRTIDLPSFAVLRMLINSIPGSASVRDHSFNEFEGGIFNQGGHAETNPMEFSQVIYHGHTPDNSRQLGLAQIA